MSLAIVNSFISFLLFLNAFDDKLRLIQIFVDLQYRITTKFGSELLLYKSELYP